MAEFKEVIKIRQRMCNSIVHCEDCELSHSKNKNQGPCSSFIFVNPNEAEEIIMKWAAEHPIKTNKDKIKELFSNDLELNACEGFCCPKDNEDEYIKCEDCDYFGFWDKEYKEPEEQKGE